MSKSYCASNSSFHTSFDDDEDEPEDLPLLEIPPTPFAVIAEEVALIKLYDRFMTVLINRYLMYFHCVTTPINKRKNENPLEIKNDFIFEDMCDLYEQSLYTCEGIFEPSLVLFYKAEY